MCVHARLLYNIVLFCFAVSGVPVRYHFHVHLLDFLKFTKKG